MLGPPDGRVKRAATALAAASDRARLDEQDEGRAAEPAQQRQLDRAGAAERPDERPA